MENFPHAVYVVSGHSGSYSDSSTWIIAWYRTEPEAQKCVDVLELLNPEIEKIHSSMGLTYQQREDRVRALSLLVSPTPFNWDPDSNFYIEKLEAGQDLASIDLSPDKISMLAHVFKENS